LSANARPASMPGFMECFRELIALPTISSVDPRLDMGNGRLVERLGEWLESLGFTVVIKPVESESGKFNLVARRGPGGQGLALTGHSDTVPVTASEWQSDPFRLTERDNRLYGLGATDMKCFFPLVIEAVRGMDLNRLQKPLCIVATCAEESTMSGARALADAGGIPARYAVIGEPTGLRPVRMHKGVMMETIRLLGRSGHASDPDLGLSALDGMRLVLNRLTRWREGLKARWNDTVFHVPAPTLNFGCIHGGDNPNRICGECDLSIDLRLLPGMGLEELRAEIRRETMQAVDETGLTVEFRPVFPGLPAMHTDADSRIVTLAEELTGRGAESADFGTEAPFFKDMGMETLILGPGDIAEAHRANEFLEMDRIDPMIRILRQMIDRLCMR